MGYLTWLRSRWLDTGTQKSEQNEYPAILTEQAWSITDLLNGKKNKRYTAGNLKWVRCMGYWPSLFSQGGWILAKFFFFECLWTETESRSINLQKTNQDPAVLTEQAWSVKDLAYGFRWNFSCGTRRVVPSWQDSSILPAWVANHSVGFDSTCRLMELAI